jgi:uncharacterized protein (TIGR00251 family)
VSPTEIPFRSAVGDGFTDLWVRVVPGAQRDGVTGVHEACLRVRVAAPPQDGAANARLIRFLARTVFCVARSRVEIVQGQCARIKRVRVHMEPARIVAALGALLGNVPEPV